MLRRIGVIASLAVTAAMFVGVTSAQADPPGSVSCIFNGLASVDPEISHEPAAGGSGTYLFSGDVDCVGVVDGWDVVPEGDDDGNADISSSGHYDNIHCGTGWAHDSSTSANPTTVIAADDGSWRIVDIDYEIAFQGLKGDMRIGYGPWTAPDARPGMLGGHWVGDGKVVIVPENQSPGNLGCVNAPVQQFLVDGSFTATHK